MTKAKFEGDRLAKERAMEIELAIKKQRIEGTKRRIEGTKQRYMFKDVTGSWYVTAEPYSTPADFANRHNKYAIQAYPLTGGVQKPTAPLHFVMVEHIVAVRVTPYGL